MPSPPTIRIARAAAWIVLGAVLLIAVSCHLVYEHKASMLVDPRRAHWTTNHVNQINQWP